jgi:hypothetical protein
VERTVRNLVDTHHEKLIAVGMKDSELACLDKEFLIRKKAAELASQGGFPEYCQVNNPELEKKYDAGDADALAFVFACAKALMLEGKKFYGEIWY